MAEKYEAMSFFSWEGRCEKKKMMMIRWERTRIDSGDARWNVVEQHHQYANKTIPYDDDDEKRQGQFD